MLPLKVLVHSGSQSGKLVVAGCALALLDAAVPATAQGSGQRVDSLSARIIITVGTDRPVLINAPGLAAIEPHLVAHPSDPRHLLAGVFLVSKLGDPRDPNFEMDMTCAALVSEDAGQSWRRYDFPTRGCGDPWVAILPRGGAVFLTLGRSGLQAYRSENGGRSWADSSVSFGRRFDHGTLAIDRTNGRFAGSVYVSSHQTVQDSSGAFRSAIFVARSADGGKTFSSPTHVIPSNLPTFPNNPIVLSDGVLIVPFVSYVRNTLDDERTDLVWSITSVDGGVTFSPPYYVSECAGHWGQLAADRSAGEYRDRLYWACWDRSKRGVYVYHSSDRGKTWSPPIQVNRGSGLAQTAAIAVNQDGVVGVSWYDAREDPREYLDQFRCQNVYFSASLDGGQTFLPDVKVSSAENCPDTPRNGHAGRRWTAGGDYHGLAATADGRFHLLWADSREGIYQLRTAIVSVDSKRGRSR
jgi:BNR repeat-like domain